MTPETREDDMLLAELKRIEIPAGVDRRAFLLRSAVAGAAADEARCLARPA